MYIVFLDQLPWRYLKIPEKAPQHIFQIPHRLYLFTWECLSLSIKTCWVKQLILHKKLELKKTNFDKFPPDLISYDGLRTRPRSGALIETGKGIKWTG